MEIVFTGIGLFVAWLVVSMRSSGAKRKRENQIRERQEREEIVVDSPTESVDDADPS